MTISARVVADSVSRSGHRVTTQVWVYHRTIHGEVMTHRMLSRNASSSRAIPVRKSIEMIRENPAVPIHWGKNQAGMQAYEEVENKEQAEGVWRESCSLALRQAEKMLELGLHKQVINRILEPYSWITVVVSATEWDNFYNLRDHAAAEPHIRRLAEVALAAQNASTPQLVEYGDWHLPFISSEERAAHPIELLIKCSVARAARVSYLNHDGTTPNIEKDVALHDRLVIEQPVHASPAEHQATPFLDGTRRSGNFIGWMQYRQTLVGQNCLSYPKLRRE
jgi:thymidylate synthase ThyX